MASSITYTIIQERKPQPVLYDYSISLNFVGCTPGNCGCGISFGGDCIGEGGQGVTSYSTSSECTSGYYNYNVGEVWVGPIEYFPSSSEGSGTISGGHPVVIDISPSSPI